MRLPAPPSIRPSRPIPLRFRTAETVESGIRSVSAISAAVIRSRRNITIVATRSAGVAVSDPPRRGGTVEQTHLALQAKAANPLPPAPDADPRSRRSSSDRPTLHDNTPSKLLPTLPAESGVTVKLHPVSSLDWGA